MLSVCNENGGNDDLDFGFVPFAREQQLDEIATYYHFDKKEQKPFCWSGKK